MNVICSTLNAKYIHTNLAIRYLKAYAAPEFNIQIKEYTIKDPILNIVTDLYQWKPEVIGFSCYIWNIEETIKVVNLLKKLILPFIIVLAVLKLHMIRVNGWKKFLKLTLLLWVKGNKPLNNC